MEEIVDRLFYTLFCKGYTPEETLRLVEDVVHIVVKDRGEFTADKVNQKLERLGWHKANVDPFTFELIISLLKNDGGQDIVNPTIH
ncbi:MAG: hypothetical protein K9N21_06880 [Deltaproteobacteria bacterium]|nr:hypothetical protein [Deltaproteobacteria bacterium]